MHCTVKSYRGPLCVLIYDTFKSPCFMHRCHFPDFDFILTSGLSRFLFSKDDTRGLRTQVVRRAHVISRLRVVTEATNIRRKHPSLTPQRMCVHYSVNWNYISVCHISKYEKNARFTAIFLK